MSQAFLQENSIPSYDEVTPELLEEAKKWRISQQNLSMDESLDNIKRVKFTPSSQYTSSHYTQSIVTMSV